MIFRRPSVNVLLVQISWKFLPSYRTCSVMHLSTFGFKVYTITPNMILEYYLPLATFSCPCIYHQFCFQTLKKKTNFLLVELVMQTLNLLRRGTLTQTQGFSATSFTLSGYVNIYSVDNCRKVFIGLHEHYPIKMGGWWRGIVCAYQ